VVYGQDHTSELVRRRRLRPGLGGVSPGAVADRIDAASVDRAHDGEYTTAITDDRGSVGAGGVQDGVAADARYGSE